MSTEPTAPTDPTPALTPFELIGGAECVLALAERFYEVMDEREPALAQLHECDAQGRVARGSRDRFGLFLIGWLGGPQDYMATHGHPRLRMRHGKVAVNVAMRDAWLRCMATAMDDLAVAPTVRPHLDQRFAEVADFLRNTDR